MYTLKTIQKLPITLDEAWDFFSSPANLKDITPAHMGFHILTDIPGKMYPGMIIAYIVKPLLGIPLKWVTEITHVIEKEYFVDFQIMGPYKIWHHQHHFKEIEGGIEMTDIVSYSLPLGFLGKWARWLFVGKKVEQIFEYRYKVLEEKFGRMN
ncbi:MAG: SRPBCC family protein [Bacteroidales bacterium]